MAETFTERWDRTEELSKDRDGSRWKRRLDSIARLIENASTCAAIAIIDDSFLIATNKNFIPNSNDQGFTLIDQVMSFLSKIAHGEPYSDDEFKAVFTAICSGAMSGLQIMAYKRMELEKPDFIDEVIRSDVAMDFRGLRDYISERAEEGHYPVDTGAAFTICLALLKDLKKTIDFVRQNKDLADGSPSEKFIKAIKNYTKNTIIHRDLLTAKVTQPESMHAEMRIISLVEDKLKNKDSKYENYIGISKLCCLDCHAFIYAINQSGYGNTIDTRGAHNVQHSGNWNAPFNISGTPPKLNIPSQGRRPDRQDPFYTEIVKHFSIAYTRAELQLQTAKKSLAIGAAGCSEYADDSQPSEGEAEEAVIQNFISILRKKQQELLQISLIPGIQVEASIFITIDRLLQDAETKTTDLHNTLKSISKNEDCTSFYFGYIRTLKTENKELSEQTSAILREKTFVGTIVADKLIVLSCEQKPSMTEASILAQQSTTVDSRFGGIATQSLTEQPKDPLKTDTSNPLIPSAGSRYDEQAESPTKKFKP